jgi:hypothetical protein
MNDLGLRIELAQNIISGKEKYERMQATAMLEDMIEQRGLEEEYISRLLDQKQTTNWTEGDHWFLIRATSEQRARAFLEAVK